MQPPRDAPAYVKIHAHFRLIIKSPAWPLFALLPLLVVPSPSIAQTHDKACATPLLAEAPRLKALLLGESHTSRDDHAWQLLILNQLAAQGRPLVLGLEMVPAARQSALDRFSSGSTDEAAFLQEVGWTEVWNHDPQLYLPLLRWARRQGVPLLALNVEPAIVRRVRQLGLAAVPVSQREGIGTPVPVGLAYRQRLTFAWQAHSSAAAASSPADLERFVDAQRLRDRAMAERIAASQRLDPRRLVVALVGRGHIEGQDGVPGQLLALGLQPVDAALRPDGCVPAPAGLRLGVYMESADGVVIVLQVAPGSAAAAAGVRVGDRVLQVNGEPMERAGQVIRRVAALQVGEPLHLTLERVGLPLEITLLLQTPSRPGGHNGALPHAAP